MLGLFTSLDNINVHMVEELMEAWNKKMASDFEFLRFYFMLLSKITFQTCQFVIKKDTSWS